MENDVKELNNDTISREEYEALLKKYNNLQKEYKQLDERNKWLLEQIVIAKKRKFGSSAEKSSSEVFEQLSLLFDEPELYQFQETQTNQTTVAEHVRNKKEKKLIMDSLPKNIEVQVTEHRREGDDLLCPVCGSKMVEIGKEAVRTLEIIPAQFIIHEDRYYNYACKECEKETGETVIVETEKVPTMYPGSYASPKSVAYLMYQKYIMGSPLYRMEQDCNRNNIPLSRQTMSNWMIHCSETWLEPLYDRLHEMLLEKDIVHADETEIQVLHEPGKKPQQKSYMWLYCTGHCEEHQIVLYKYCDGRGMVNPESFLTGYKGKYLQTDGYAGYNNIPVIHIGCLAHLRRKFHEAVEVLPKGNRSGAAVEGEAYCDAIFKIEKDLNSMNLSVDELYIKRQELVKPILDEFLAWGNNRQASSKSKLGAALTYLKNQGDKIRNYLLDGRLEASNNRAERNIKMFVIDRKNFLFANTPLGAKSSAVTFSIIQTAKENGLNPYKYLEYIFTEAPKLKATTEDWITPLLPENAPDTCKVPNNEA